MKINIKTIGKMYKNDLSKVKTSWVTVVIMIGLAVLPSLYAWVNIYASWDPYSNTKGIKVGIVNNDVGGTIKGIDINIGNEVTKLLKDNNKLGWTFYNDADEGIKKVQDGEVYATIIIPSDFSLEMSTLLDKNPVKPSLEYYVNQKINAIAPKMTDSGASTIQKEISQSFVETVTKKLFEILNEAGVKIDENYDDIEKYKTALYTLNDNYPKLNKALDELVEKSDGAFVQLDKTSENIAFIQDTLTKTIEFNEQLSKDLTGASNKIDELSPNVKENLYLMQSTFSKISTTTDDFSNKLSIYKPDVLSDIDDAISETARLSTRMKEVSQDLNSLGENAPKDLKELSDNIIKNLNAYQNLLEDLRKSTAVIGNSVKILNSLKNISDTISGQIEDLQGRINEKLIPIDNATGLKLFEGVVDKLEDIQREFYNTSKEIKKIMTTLTYIESDINSNIDTINSQIDDMKDLIQESLTDLAASTSENAAKASSDLKIMSTNLDKLKGQLTTLRDNLAKNNNIESLLPDISKLTLNISNDLNKLQNNVDDILPKIQKALQNGSIGTASLNTIMGNMKDDMNYIKDFLSKISSHAQIAVKDVKDFQDRNKNMEKKLNTITSEIKSIDSEISLQDIVTLLGTNGDTEGDFMAMPVNLKTHNLFPVANYGAGLTPFYTTLSLWVGALLLSALLSVKFHNGDFSYSPREEYLGKYLLFISLGIIQALIVSLGDIFVLGIKVQFPVLFVLLAIYSSIIFTTIVYTLVALFNNVGKAIGIVFLVLQLAGAGGTFPIQVTPDFFQKIHSVLPFTYAISGMREALAGVTYSTLSTDIITLSVFFMIFLILGYILKPRTTKLFSKLTPKLHDSGVIGH